MQSNLYIYKSICTTSTEYVAPLLILLLLSHPHDGPQAGILCDMIGRFSGSSEVFRAISDPNSELISFIVSIIII